MGEWDFQVMATDERNKDQSEMAAREQFLRENPPISGIVSPGDLRTIDLIHRPWRNNKGLWFQLGDNNIIQAHLSEIPPGGNTTRHRHTTDCPRRPSAGSTLTSERADHQQRSRSGGASSSTHGGSGSGSSSKTLCAYQ